MKKLLLLPLILLSSGCVCCYEIWCPPPTPLVPERVLPDEVEPVKQKPDVHKPQNRKHRVNSVV
jgi:hypothetical protein